MPCNKIIIRRPNAYIIKKYVKNMYPKYKFTKVIRRGSKYFNGIYELTLKKR